MAPVTKGSSRTSLGVKTLASRAGEQEEKKRDYSRATYISLHKECPGVGFPNLFIISKVAQTLTPNPNPNASPLQNLPKNV